MAELVYHCPHCGASHQIDESLIGDRVTCRKCGRPFEAAAPVAQPVAAAPGEKAAFRVEPGEGEIEETILRVHPALVRESPLRFLGVCLVFVVGLAVAGLGLIGSRLLPGGLSQSVFVVVGLVLAGLAGLAWLAWWVRSRFTALTVTNRRSVLRRGLLARETTEVRHRDVRNIQVNQGTLERLLGVGDLAISSAGQDNLEIAVRGIPDPEKIAAVIRDMQS
jgi:predicted Zn finger-like uncharacterized protein